VHPLPRHGSHRSATPTALRPPPLSAAATAAPQRAPPLSARAAAAATAPTPAPARRRLGTPDVIDRVQNLYFAYLLVLRAVVKAGPLLAEFEYNTGLGEEDARTRDLVSRLVRAPV
jgi:hypothetical protein